MFGLFKKKEERREKNEPVQGAEYKEFAAQFAPEELSVLAVTGSKRFFRRQDGRPRAVDGVHRADRLDGGGRR